MNRKYMMLSMLALAACHAAPVAAQEPPVRTGIITESQCEIVAQSESVGGGAVGGATGAVVGGLLTGLVFGREYANAGAALGSVGGTVVGAKMGASRTYNCLLKVQTSDGVQVYGETTGKLRNVGQSVIITRLNDGSYSVR